MTASTGQTSHSFVPSQAPNPTVIQADGLPNRYLIETAFVPQAPLKDWSQPWQDACEEAALLTVKYYYDSIKTVSPEKIKTDLESIFKYESEQGWGHDINQDQMSDIATNFFGFRVKKLINPTINDFKKTISEDIPIVLTANGKTLFQENKHFKSGGPYYHALVILGYDDERKKFIVHDVGTQFGSYFQYSYSLLLDSIHDLPDNRRKEDIDQGEFSALTLLK